MSDAERPGDARRERLDWGDATPTDEGEQATDHDAAQDSTDSADDQAEDGDLCVIEDPTCEACQ